MEEPRRELDETIVKIAHTVREIARLMKLSKTEVANREKVAKEQLRLSLLMSPNNTHLLAHDPVIGEIDNLFRLYPWMEYLELPAKEGYKIKHRTVISREEWRKSLEKGSEEQPTQYTIT